MTLVTEIVFLPGIIIKSVLHLSFVFVFFFAQNEEFKRMLHAKRLSADFGSKMVP